MLHTSWLSQITWFSLWQENLNLMTHLWPRKTVTSLGLHSDHICHRVVWRWECQLINITGPTLWRLVAHVGLNSTKKFKTAALTHYSTTSMAKALFFPLPVSRSIVGRRFLYMIGCRSLMSSGVSSKNWAGFNFFFSAGCFFFNRKNSRCTSCSSQNREICQMNRKTCVFPYWHLAKTFTHDVN